MPRIGDAERRRTFGEPCQTSNLRMYTTPWGMRVQAHFLVVPRLAAACDLAHRASSWRPQRIDSYNCRPVRGSTSAPSLHAYGLAWDFFATPPNVPPPGGVWTPENGVPSEFAAAFTRYGFVWGATFGRPDVPHIEWADGRPPPVPAPSPPKPLVTKRTKDDMLIAYVDNGPAYLITGGVKILLHASEIDRLKAVVPVVNAPELIAATPDAPR